MLGSIALIRELENSYMVQGDGTNKYSRKRDSVCLAVTSACDNSSQTLYDWVDSSVKS